MPIFVQAEFRAAETTTDPHHQGWGGGRLNVNVQPFEVVLWLPLVDEVRQVVMAMVPELRSEKVRR